MHKSLVERLFPRPDSSLLPQHMQHEYLHTTAPRIILNESSRSSVSGSETSSQPRSRRTLQNAPLSASLIHHDDPFLPIERAARALQETIQSLLDIQSNVLGGRVNGASPEENLSTGSRTPTQSIAAPIGGSPSLRTVPVRQPKKKKINLQSARKGLAKSMGDFAQLRDEEARLLNAEAETRASALRQVDEFGEKKEALNSRIASIKREEASQSANDLKSEAQTLGNEIKELEHKIFELRVRQRHLLSKADEIESSQNSKASSYQHTLSDLDKEVNAFLHRPPVHRAFINGNELASTGMYSLKSGRRTLEMAKEQWTSELDAIYQRNAKVEEEREALIEGKQIWLATIARINTFETNLQIQNELLANDSASRSPNKEPLNPTESMQQILSELEEVIRSLEQDLQTAESRNWNLLVCAIGSELEAFHQAREMLQYTHNSAVKDMNESGLVAGSTDQNLFDDIRNEPIVEITVARNGQDMTGSGHSNQSLKDTLSEFARDTQVAITDRDKGREHHKDESEDDDPPSDFLISQ